MTDTAVDPIAAFKDELAGLGAVHRFTDAELEVVYSLAYNQYTQGMYEQALRYFGFLTLYRPANERFLKGLAACQFMAKHYVEAAATYSFLMLLNPEDSEALCLGGQSLLLNGEVDEARACLEYATQLPGAKPEHVGKARALLELIAA